MVYKTKVLGRTKDTNLLEVHKPLANEVYTNHWQMRYTQLIGKRGAQLIGKKHLKHSNCMRSICTSMATPMYNVQGWPPLCTSMATPMYKDGHPCVQVCMATPMYKYAWPPLRTSMATPMYKDGHPYAQVCMATSMH